MNFKFPNKITYKEFWNIYSKSFLYLEFSFLTLQILTWRYPTNNLGKTIPKLIKETLKPLYVVGRRNFDSNPYIYDGNLHSILIIISIIVFIPFLYTLVRRRVRDMGIDPFSTYILYLPLLTVSITGISVMFKSVEVFLKQCCTGVWIDNVYYNRDLYRTLTTKEWVFSDPPSNVTWFHLRAFVIIISLLCIPYLIMVRTKD